MNSLGLYYTVIWFPNTINRLYEDNENTSLDIKGFSKILRKFSLYNQFAAGTPKIFHTEPFITNSPTLLKEGKVFGKRSWLSD